MNRAATVPTLQLTAEDVVRIVRARGLSAAIAGVAERIGRDFARWEAFDRCARVASHSPEGVIELMPVADAREYAFKCVNGHPGNTRSGLPTVMAFGVLADVATGTPLLLAETLAALSILRHSDAVALMPEPLLGHPETRGLVPIDPCPLTPCDIELLMLSRPDVPLTPAAAYFAHCLGETCRTGRGRPPRG
jgi:ornithine cyclodeaminase